MESILITPYVKQYLDDVLRMQPDLYDSNFSGMTYNVHFYMWVYQMLTEPDNHPYVVLDGDICVGFYIFDDGGYLKQIYLLKDYRGRGLGKQMMLHFEEELQSKQIQYAGLHVSAENEDMFRYYCAMGYECVQYQPDVRSHFMQKRL